MARHADLVFVDGAVFAVGGARRPTAVAVADGVITAVGDGEAVAEHIGPRTEVLTLGGRLLLPGFQDAHIHPVYSGVELARCSLYDATGAAEAEDAVSSYARAHPDEPWVVGGGWSMDWYPGGTPDAADLDRLVPDRPAYLRNRDGHGAWVNTKALQVAGIDAATADPRDGRIERRPDGSPQGTLHEGAMHLVEAVVPPVTAADMARGLETAQRLLVSLGITAWQDAAVDAEVHAAYRSLADSGRLLVDVVGALWWDRHRGLEQVDELLQRRSEVAPGYRPTSVKIMLDGVMENFTASVLEPYLDERGDPTANRGIDFVDPDGLKVFVTRLDAEGFQIHFHALGDRAVRNALDAVEAARSSNGPGDGRHHLAHIQLVHPEDIPRFHRLDVVANAQPYWAAIDGYQTELTIPFLGPERAARQYPFRSLLDAGARMAMGSDWSVSTPDPLLEIEVAVNRVLPETRHEAPFYPEERVGLEEAITAFTLGTAYVNHRDDESGTVEVGKRADLVVIDRDPFEKGAGFLGDAAVDMTIIGGEIVYRREDAA